MDVHSPSDRPRHPGLSVVAAVFLEATESIEFGALQRDLFAQIGGDRLLFVDAFDVVAPQLG